MFKILGCTQRLIIFTHITLCIDPFIFVYMSDGKEIRQPPALEIKGLNC